MGGTQRLAAVAAVSHARHYYNNTQPEVHQSDTAQYNVNIFFVSATLCGVIVAVCAACWRRAPPTDKPDEVGTELSAGVYTVSADTRFRQVHDEPPGPPPAYETVVHNSSTVIKDYDDLQEVVTESCPRCQGPSSQPDTELPSYEAAVLLRDTKL